jgi:hypothetical protein
MGPGRLLFRPVGRLSPNRAKEVEFIFMNELGGAHRFQQLSPEAKAQYITASQEMTGLARSYAVPIFFAPPLSNPGKINGASSCLLQLDSKNFVGTASHVLEGYEERVRLGERLNWQVGNLRPFDPLPRVAWRDRQRDIVLLSISDDEARSVGPCSISIPPKWPPPLPQEGDWVIMAGYPRALREEDSVAGRIGAGPASAVYRVTEVRPGSCVCVIERKDLISFNGGPLPEPDADMGGLSGGPVLLVGNASYPLVGIIMSRWNMSSGGFEFMQFATLNSVVIEEIKGMPHLQYP